MVVVGRVSRPGHSNECTILSCYCQWEQMGTKEEVFLDFFSHVITLLHDTAPANERTPAVGRANLV